MSKRITLFFAALSLFFASACGGKADLSTELATDPNEKANSSSQEVGQNKQSTPMTELSIWKSASDVKIDCDRYIELASKLRNKLLSGSGDRTLTNTLKPLNEMYTHIDTIWSLTYLYMSVAPQEEVRSAAEECDQRISKFSSDIALDRDLYDAIAAVNPDNLDPMARRFLSDVLEDYRLAGVDKGTQTRAELARLNNEMTELKQAFSRAIANGGRSFEATKSDLKGLPVDFFKSHPKGKNGRIKIETDRPTTNAVLAFADNEKIRKTMMKKFLSRAYPENKSNLEKLLQLRFEYAKNLGFEDWASYNAADKMAKDTTTISGFLDQVGAIARPAMEKELAIFLEEKKKHSQRAKRVFEWDKSYLRNRVMASKYDVDPKELRAYFEYERVKNGILDVNEKLFGLEFKANPSIPTWHEDVDVYDVFEEGVLTGRFYLDMHPRAGKYDYAMEQPMVPGVRGKQLPQASLICNFPRPSDSAPALMQHSDVQLFFHEFGHLMHQLLAGNHEWVTMSGTACEADFVEAPSQVLEEFAFEPEVLRQFAFHHETGEVIPSDLIEKLRKSIEIDKGLYVMRQLFYAAVSLDLHVGDPRSTELMTVVKEAKKTFSPYPFEKGTYVYASFSHLEGYSSMCYSYMWTLAMAKDLYSKFGSAPSVMDPAISRAYRKAIMDPGGTIDANEMMKTFLGREYSFESFQTWLEN